MKSSLTRGGEQGKCAACLPTRGPSRLPLLHSHAQAALLQNRMEAGQCAARVLFCRRLTLMSAQPVAVPIKEPGRRCHEIQQTRRKASLAPACFSTPTCTFPHLPYRHIFHASFLPAGRGRTGISGTAFPPTASAPNTGTANTARQQPGARRRHRVEAAVVRQRQARRAPPRRASELQRHVLLTSPVRPLPSRPALRARRRSPFPVRARAFRSPSSSGVLLLARSPPSSSLILPYREAEDMLAGYSSSSPA